MGDLVFVAVGVVVGVGVKVSVGVGVSEGMGVAVAASVGVEESSPDDVAWAKTPGVCSVCVAAPFGREA